MTGNTLFETENFRVFAFPTPHVDRDEGGHLKVETTKNIKDRADLPPHMAVEFAWLVTLVGEAFKTVMNNQGVEVVKLNYLEMGNWAFKKPNPTEHFHIHIYGRVFGAKHQPFPEALYLPDRKSGFYDTFKALTKEDETLLTQEIVKLGATEKYKEENWRINK